MGSSRFWLKVADEESKSIPHEFPRSHWLKATGQCVIERYLSATMQLTRLLNEPRSENTGLRGFRQSPTQTGLCSDREWLEA